MRTRPNELDSTEVPLANTCKEFVIIQKHAGKHDSTFKITMDLKSIEPMRVRFTPVEGKPWAYVDIGTTNDEETIQTPDRKTAGVALRFDEPDFAKRFAKALRHAVELCGGKPSTF